MNGAGHRVRGTAEALCDVEPPTPYFSAEIIRIHPDRIVAWAWNELNQPLDGVCTGVERQVRSSPHA
jgi:hypothetical protein